MYHRILHLSVSEPCEYIDFLENIPIESQFATLEFDLLKGHVRLPGGFTTTIESLMRAASTGMTAHSKYIEDRRKQRQIK